MRIRSFIKHKDGNAAVEFALVAPIFFLLLMGIVEIGLILFASSVMENAATMAARYGITGDDYSAADGFQKNTSGMSREEFIKSTIYDLSLGLMDPNNVRINNKIFDSFAGATIGDRDNGAGEGDYGNTGQGVIYFVTYRWTLFTPLIGQFFNEGVFEITSSVLVANEQY